MLNYLRKRIAYNSPIRRLWHLSKGVLAALINDFPAKKMVIIGVTGTNGKTTTAHMIEHILRKNNKKVAMISTVELSLNGKVTPNETKKTTLSPFATQKFLKKCLKEGVEYVVLEASSHALHQNRLWGIPFRMGVLTNITHEHLDYHGNIAAYAKAKKILFKNISQNYKKREKNPSLIAIGADTRFFNDFMQTKAEHKMAYGIETGDLNAIDIERNALGDTYTMRCRMQGGAKLHSKLNGDFNIENTLAATAIGFGCGVVIKDCAKALESFEGVEGRMQKFSSPKGFDVIVDFALTPDALDRLYSTLKSTCSGRLIGIIGSCGERDKKKRPDMGQVVAEHTDITIVTDEEPYSEDPMVIMQAILKGAEKVKKLNTDLYLIEDRYKSIEFAIKEARAGDMVVVTGMGSFTTRNMNKGVIPWDEREVVKEIIAKN